MRITSKLSIGSVRSLSLSLSSVRASSAATNSPPPRQRHGAVEWVLCGLNWFSTCGGKGSWLSSYPRSGKRNSPPRQRQGAVKWSYGHQDRPRFRSAVHGGLVPLPRCRLLEEVRHRTEPGRDCEHSGRHPHSDPRTLRSE